MVSWVNYSTHFGQWHVILQLWMDDLSYEPYGPEVGQCTLSSSKVGSMNLPLCWFPQALHKSWVYWDSTAHTLLSFSHWPPIMQDLEISNLLSQAGWKDLTPGSSHQSVPTMLQVSEGCTWTWWNLEVVHPSFTNGYKLHKTTFIKQHKFSSWYSSYVSIQMVIGFLTTSPWFHLPWWLPWSPQGSGPSARSPSGWEPSRWGPQQGLWGRNVVIKN